MNYIQGRIHTKSRKFANNTIINGIITVKQRLIGHSGCNTLNKVLHLMV